LKITFLGTGTSQGVPLIACDCQVCQSDDPRDKRLRSSVMIEDNGTSIIIDAGPDFRQQMLREEVRKVDALLITHGHKDHIGGLDDIRAFNYISGKPVDVYASATTNTDIRRDLYYVFRENKYPGIPKINLIDVKENNQFKIRDIEVMPIKVSHHFLDILGFRIGDFTYITDCRTLPASSIEKVMNTKVLVINALRKREHISHLNLSQALEIIDMTKAKKAYITHISHQMGKHDVVSRELPGNVELAYDGLKVMTHDPD
jgi:phosphoribosyl 1,2-cyclic phosphate phosphodiesterase